MNVNFNTIQIGDRVGTKFHNSGNAEWEVCEKRNASNEFLLKNIYTKETIKIYVSHCICDKKTEKENKERRIDRAKKIGIK